MSKYEKLWKYFLNKNEDMIRLSFKEMEAILGFKIDHSFLNYKKELVNYNYEVKSISMKNEYIDFKRLINGNK